MNNYLASIAARTLNHTLSVRPRLGGRFEFADASSERSIDSPEPSPLTGPKPPPPKRETASAIETTEQQETEGRPKKAFDLVPRLGQSATPAPEVHPEPATGSLTISANVDVPQPATTRPATQPKIAELQPQNVHVEVRPVENAIDSSQSAAARKQPLLEVRRENHSEAPLGSVADDHQPIVAAGTPRSRQRSPATPQSVGGNDELEASALPATAQSVITREKPVIERELETIIIREKQTLDEPTRLNPLLTQSVPMPGAALSGASEEDGSSVAPIIVQPSIAPLLETGLEHLLLNRPNSQPAPTVHVTIGRIEVRAVQSSQSPAKPRATTPVMNLDDYLMRRGQGGTR